MRDEATIVETLAPDIFASLLQLCLSSLASRVKTGENYCVRITRVKKKGEKLKIISRGVIA